jgi:flagellar hook-associated protein 3 FlgL
MLSGISAYNGSFLADLNQTESRISQDEQQISSGIRVSQASDDPSAVSSILDYQEEIDRVTQVQTNLDSAAGTASAADLALQTASKLLDQLASIGGEGASTLASPTRQAALVSQVQQIAQQMVGLANTTSQGQYVFGSDGATTEPYTYTGTAPKGVTQNSATGNTSMLRDASGNQITPAQTAQKIFDVQSALGTSATGNVFQAIYDLGTALAQPDSVSFGAGNTVNLNSATLLAGPGPTFPTQTYTFQIGTQSIPAAVTGSVNGISGTAALGQLNSTLSAYGITASASSNGTLQFSGASAFTVSDSGPVPSTASGISNEASGTNIASTQTNIANATQEIQNAVAQIGTATTTNGNIEDWIQGAQSDASDRLVTLKTGLSSLQDADVAADATQLTTDNTALEASMSAHASLSNKSLFSYMG